LSDVEEQPLFKVVHKADGRHPVPVALISSK
jgi:hypothetical protein